MAMKEWLQWLPPPRSLLALMLAVTGFSGRLFASYVTHSPTLLVDTCHSLCRLVGLITTLLSYKYERADEGAGREGRLRNTFGWARIEVVGRLSVHVLFASFALALVVNALQLGVHSSHLQPPRYPKVIVGSAVLGLLLHTVNYMLLAGWNTAVQALLFGGKNRGLDLESFGRNLEEQGVVFGVVLELWFPIIIISLALKGRELSYSRRLSMTEGGGVVLKTGSGEPVLAHAPIDIVSSLFAIGAGLTLEWEPEVARVADPALSACAAIVLVIFNFPFMRSAGLVLLQTVPEGLGADELREAALRVPGVRAIHELHVWQLHRDKIVATAHIAYGSHEDYLRNSELVCDVFKRHGISLVTLQPEFAFDSVGGTEEEKKALVEFANIACSCPCAKECTAPRCCEAPRIPLITRI